MCLSIGFPPSDIEQRIAILKVKLYLTLGLDINFFLGATVETGGSVEIGAEGEGAAGEETKKKKKKKKKKGGGGGGGGEATDDFLHPESNPTGQYWVHVTCGELPVNCTLIYMYLHILHRHPFAVH